MNTASFDLLVRNGLRRLGKGEIRALASQARDSAIDTGEARYCFLGSVLTKVADHFDQVGALEPSLAQEINAALRVDLDRALSAPDAAEGAALAARLEEHVSDVLSRSTL